MAATIITIANNKGGCGKTATALALSADMARRGYSVLIVDIDGQANTSLSLRIPAEAADAFSLLRGQGGEPAELAPNLYGIRSTDDMNDAEHLYGMGNGTAIRRMLQPFAGRFDYIIIDTAPDLHRPTLNAIMAADYILIPLQASFLALQGMAKMDSVLQRLCRREVCGIAVTMYDGRKTLHRQMLEAAQQRYGAAVFPTQVRSCIAVAEAGACGRTLYDYAPNCTAAQDYAQITAEVIERARLAVGDFGNISNTDNISNTKL